MSSPFNPDVGPDRDNLPLKKRDQRQDLQPAPPPEQQQQQQQQCDVATFKVPFPHRSQSEVRLKHTVPFQPIPKRVPALYQPWVQSSTRSRPQLFSTFREHHGWLDWREANPLHLGWDLHSFQHHGGFSVAPAFYMGHPHEASRISPVSLITEGYHRMGGSYGWEQLKTLRDENSNTNLQCNGRNRGPYARRRERRVDHFPRVVKVSRPSLGLSPHEDLKLQPEALHKSTTQSGHSRVGDERPSNTFTSMRDDAPRSPPPVSSEQDSSSSSSSSSLNRFPWLLPHFVAGSLIELKDGRLRKVEHLQTEDFLLGSLACPDLRLSCCTVQSITASASSSVSRLLVLLHDQQSQELVDVYVEYPFFVRGWGWSSCSPQRTARLCGLQCRQLSVGDVCLALTPISTPRGRSDASSEPGASSKERCEPAEGQKPQVPTRLEEPAGSQRKTIRRRHQSAPELRVQGSDCV